MDPPDVAAAQTVRQPRVRDCRLDRAQPVRVLAAADVAAAEDE